MRTRWIASAGAALALAGGVVVLGDELQDGGAEPGLQAASAQAAGPKGGERCLRVGRPLARALRASLVVPGSGLRGLRAVKSSDAFGGGLDGLADGLYFVATDLDGPGELGGPDDVAVWAVDRAAFTTANGVVVPADDTARRYAELGASATLDDVGLDGDSDGLKAARNCAEVVAKASAEREARELAAGG